MENAFNLKKSLASKYIHSSNVAVLVVDKNRHNLYANAYTCELFGYTQKEILAEDASFFHISKESFIRFGEEAFGFALLGKPVAMDYQFKKKDGSIFWGHISGDLIENEHEVLWTLIDITSYKNLEHENKLQSEMLNQIKDSVLIADLEGKIMSWNKGSEVIFGYTQEEAVGKNYSMLFVEEDREQHLKNIKILIEDGAFSGDLRFVKKDGDIVHVYVSTSILKDEKDTPYGTIGYCQDISERREHQERLKYLSEHDALTNLPNRTLFNSKLLEAIKKASRDRNKTALFFIDLDHFKEINDSLGHEIGDKVLQEVTKRLSSVIRKEDTLSRLGGDEFTIIIDAINDSNEASSFAQKILTILSKPLKIEEYSLYISSSIGISTYPDDGHNIQDLIKFADSAMYKAKKEGRNNFQFYSKELTVLALQRVLMETNLRKAIDRNEFVVYYQAQVNASSNQIVGLEALVRWIHPEEGIISPMEFIPLAEATGLIVQIDRFVMLEAMKQYQVWYKMGLNPGVLALNLSVQQLKKNDFITTLQETIQKIGYNPKNLELEVTEGQVMENPEEAIATLKEIRSLGVSLAIDDFGTGYSSLAYLKKLPINKIKIDQSFVRGLPYDEEDAGIVKAVIAFAKSLKLNIIAEGVEETMQKDFLLQNGCVNIQGYLYSKPSPKEVTQELLKKGIQTKISKFQN